MTGIRFYKASTNSGTHIGSLWSASGTLLASATFTGESASGWQQVNFSTPVAIAASTTYIAGYLAPNGHYSDTSNGFATADEQPAAVGARELHQRQRRIRLQLHERLPQPAASTRPTTGWTSTSKLAFDVHSIQPQRQAALRDRSRLRLCSSSHAAARHPRALPPRRPARARPTSAGPHATTQTHRDVVTRRSDHAAAGARDGCPVKSTTTIAAGRAVDRLVTTILSNPCTLVSRAEAQAILGRPIDTPVDAPLGPTCIYQLVGTRNLVTLTAESIDFSDDQTAHPQSHATRTRRSHSLLRHLRTAYDIRSACPGAGSARHRSLCDRHPVCRQGSAPTVDMNVGERDQDGTADLAIIVVSTNEAHWLEPCLSTVFAHAGDATLDVVVVDNESTDGTRELVESELPRGARRELREPRLRARQQPRARTTDARYVLFLNPDTEIVEGTFGELVELLDARAAMSGWPACASSPPTARSGRPSAASRAPTRALGEALGSERWPVHPRLGRGARARPGRLRAGARVRLDLGLLHARPPRGAAERRAARRALLHLLRGARPLPADQARRLASPPPPGR